MWESVFRRMPGQGIDPTVWGPIAWTWLHNVSSRWDHRQLRCRDNKIYTKAVGGWVNMLPCRSCRESFCEFYRMLRHKALECGSAEEWAYDLHNHVNLKLHQAGVPGKWPPPSLDRVNQTHRSTIHAVDPVWPMLLVFASHYDKTGAKNRTRVYRNYVASLAALYLKLGDLKTSGRLKALSNTIQGRFTAQELEQRVVALMTNRRYR